MYSDPMPGENFENAAEREKALAEKEAIANGENFNPNITNEDAEAFSNLENEVPFAGDNPEEEQGKKEHDSDNPLTAAINEQWDQGITPNLKDIEETVNRDYMEGAIEQSTSNADIQADIAETERDSAGDEDVEGNRADNPHDIAEATAVQAISADALSEDLVDKIKAGDEEAIAKSEEAIERATEAMELADKTNLATAMNAEGDVETRMATDVAAQAVEMAQEAIDNINEAKTEYESMSDEEKEIAEKAAEAAEINGTDFEAEKAKLEDSQEENDDDFKPDLSQGIFG